jgi:hypothetical protein
MGDSETLAKKRITLTIVEPKAWQLNPVAVYGKGVANISWQPL